MMSNAKYSGPSALMEYMLQGNRVTLLEAIMLFGVQAPNKTLTDMKRKGFIIKSAVVPMVAVVRRINEVASMVPPDSLPIKEIQLREYWVNR